MKLSPDEIASILKDQISGFEDTADVEEIGTVIQVGDGIARVYGLERCIALEMLELPHGVTGLALNLEESNVAVVLFGEWQKVREGDTVRRTGKVMSFPVGEALIGRVVNPLGVPIDGGPAIETTEQRERQSIADLVAHLTTDADSSALSGAEIVAASGWFGLRAHPRPTGSISFGGPEIPEWLDDALRAVVGVSPG